jgi:hypothetical protein
MFLHFYFLRQAFMDECLERIQVYQLHRILIQTYIKNSKNDNNLLIKNALNCEWNFSFLYLLVFYYVLWQSDINFKCWKILRGHGSSPRFIISYSQWPEWGALKKNWVDKNWNKWLRTVNGNDGLLWLWPQPQYLSDKTKTDNSLGQMIFCFRQNC